jgi:hypothetical protein
MALWISTLLFVTGFGLGLRIRHRGLARRRELIARQRRVEQPNSFYAAPGVRRLMALERWGSIPFEQLHSVNRDEVSRLLRLVESAGPDVLSSRERQFLDTMVAQG